jgi:hypothetical protein
MRLGGLLAVVLLLSGEARAERIDVPVDLGVGPELLIINNPVFRDQAIHFGLKINVEAVLSHKLLLKEKRRIPKQYQKMVLGMNELRITPSIFIPDSLIISPKIANTALYGISWRPIAGDIPLVQDEWFFIKLGAGLDLTTFFLYSDNLPTTFFLRPGVDVKLEMVWMMADEFGVGLGWQSTFYIPQPTGLDFGSFFSVQPWRQDIWHIGQAFLQLHFRFPYTVTL